MSIWDISNDIDVISYKISSVRNVLEIIAERIVDEPESGAVWAASEMLETLEEKLMAIGEKAMELHRAEHAEHAELIKPTKEKKK
jgi:hypothetical protein